MVEIFCTTKCRGIYLALFTNPERDLVVLVFNQISWIKIKKELFVNKRRHLGRICLHFNGQCFGIIFSDFVTNSVITDKPNFVSFLVLIFCWYSCFIYH